MRTNNKDMYRKMQNALNALKNGPNLKARKTNQALLGKHARKMVNICGKTSKMPRILKWLKGSGKWINCPEKRAKRPEIMGKTSAGKIQCDGLLFSEGFKAFYFN